ncbi:T9SS type A sorting domain-containing protein [Flavobacterium haoranii]|uniref:Por secretion system C-terminal sorting domain-containing protein n=1 Tax=Flavobacterium haoranii TaxID=683124 RepID=A0A1M6DC75_9FLAO|nr:T9SS type A sorting domain-containing protein [Flavobacterium haoranii]SHI70638.1 Por secretion system C-terminal sorting domain-containing protein [Flavobacterium haoranii]
MKKFIFLIVFLLSCYSNAQIINFPDPVFKAVLLQSSTSNPICGGIKIDANDNGEIDIREAEAIYTISLPPGNVTDVTGIEYFVNLMYCGLSSNQIIHADFTHSPNLQTLGVNNNQLQKLNVTGLTQFYFINCGGNPLTSVNFSSLPALDTCICSYLDVTELDFSNNPVFRRLACNNNINMVTVKINNGYPHVASNTIYNSCWDNTPNLTYVCVDSFEQAAMEDYLYNSCGLTNVIVTDNCAMSNESFTTNNITIAPNPSNGIFTLSFTTTLENATIEVYNLLGQKVYISKLNNLDIYNLDLSGFTSGTYLLKINSNKKIYNYKLFKK